MAAGTLVFVPGLLGSHVRFPLVPEYLGRIWVDPVKLLAGGLHSMRLTVPGEAAPPPIGPPLVGGQPHTFYYGPMLAALRLLGWRVSSPDVDWRKPLREDASRLADHVRSLRGRHPVVILCHSRGGLVARAAITYLDQTGDRYLVSRVCCMGTPHQGTLTVADFINGTHPVQELIMNVARHLPNAAGHWIGLKTINQIARSWPSFYELLPAPGAEWLPLQPPEVLYSPSTWAGAALNPPAVLLANALASWQAMPAFPPDLHVINVVGHGSRTPVGVNSPSRMTDPSNLLYSTSGDGVVDTWSAAMSARQTIRTPTQHDAMPYDTRLLGPLNAALTGESTADVTLPGDVFSIPR